MAVPFSKLRRFSAAIFDLDGVIVDSERAHLCTFNSLLSRLGIRISSSFWKLHYTGIGSTAIMKDVFSKNAVSDDLHEWVAARAKIYQEHVEKQGLPPIRGFLEFYAMLKKKGVKMHVASGGHNEHIAASLSSIGLPRVPFVGHEDVKRQKPSPDLFLLAAKKLHVKPSECIVFEDSLAGVKAAKNAGMVCIALSTTVPRKRLYGRAALVVKNYESAALKRAVADLLLRR